MEKLARKKRSREEPLKKLERQREWIGRKNYTINGGNVLRDAYRLLNAVLADNSIAHVAVNKRDALVELRDRFVEDELVDLLIGTAVMNRAQDDHMSGPRSDASEISFVPVDQPCGRLVNYLGTKKEAQIELTLREACNKIIHSDQIIVETREVADTAFPPMPPIVFIFGTLGKNEWRAELDIVDYVRATVKNFGDL